MIGQVRDCDFFNRRVICELTAKYEGVEDGGNFTSSDYDPSYAADPTEVAVLHLFSSVATAADVDVSSGSAQLQLAAAVGKGAVGGVAVGGGVESAAAKCFKVYGRCPYETEKILDFLRQDYPTGLQDLNQV